MKLLVPKIELKVLRTLCSQNEETTPYLLSLLNEQFFHYPPTKAAYERIRILVRKNTEVPIWDEVINDPAIDEDNRIVLQKFKTQGYVNKRQSEKAFKILDKYKKMRQFAFLSEEIIRNLKKKTVNFDDLADKASNKLTQIRTSTDKSDYFFHIGKNNNTTKIAKRVLTKDAVHYLPTGFKVYDSVNRGFAKKAAVLLSASTGAGKTLVSMQISRNMAEYGARVCYVPLEMDENEMMQRRMSNLSHISMSKIIDPENQLTKSDRIKLLRDYKIYVTRLKRKHSGEAFFVPPEDMTIEEICFLLKPFDYDCIMIDYLGLLGGVGGDRQWQKLDEAMRFMKVFGKNTNTCMLASAQLTDEMTTRFSKSLYDHCNNAWRWSYTDNNILYIDQPKARQQKQFRFPLYGEFEYMTVRDLNQDEQSLAVQQEQSPNRKEPRASFTKEKK